MLPVNAGEARQRYFENLSKWKPWQEVNRVLRGVNQRTVQALAENPEIWSAFRGAFDKRGLDEVWAGKKKVPLTYVRTVSRELESGNSVALPDIYVPDKGTGEFVDSTLLRGLRAESLGITKIELLHKRCLRTPNRSMYVSCDNPRLRLALIEEYFIARGCAAFGHAIIPEASFKSRRAGPQGFTSAWHDSEKEAQLHAIPQPKNSGDDGGLLDNDALGSDFARVLDLQIVGQSVT